MNPGRPDKRPRLASDCVHQTEPWTARQTAAPDRRLPNAASRAAGIPFFPGSRRPVVRISALMLAFVRLALVSKFQKRVAKMALPDSPPIDCLRRLTAASPWPLLLNPQERTAHGQIESGRPWCPALVLDRPQLSGSEPLTDQRAASPSAEKAQSPNCNPPLVTRVGTHGEPGKKRNKSK